MSATSPATSAVYSDYNLTASPYDWKVENVEILNKQIQSLHEMFRSLKRMKKDIQVPVAQIAVDRMEGVADEFRDAMETMIITLQSMQDRANYFYALENDAWELQESDSQDEDDSDWINGRPIL